MKNQESFDYIIDRFKKSSYELYEDTNRKHILNRVKEFKRRVGGFFGISSKKGDELINILEEMNLSNKENAMKFIEAVSLPFDASALPNFLYEKKWSIYGNLRGVALKFDSLEKRYSIDEYIIKPKENLKDNYCIF
jgi:hypothetical protein